MTESKVLPRYSQVLALLREMTPYTNSKASIIYEGLSRNQLFVAVDMQTSSLATFWHTEILRRWSVSLVSIQSSGVGLHFYISMTEEFFNT